MMMQQTLRDSLHIVQASVAGPVLVFAYNLGSIAVHMVQQESIVLGSGAPAFDQSLFILVVVYAVTLVLAMLFGLPLVTLLRRLNRFSYSSVVGLTFVLTASIMAFLNRSSVQVSGSNGYLQLGKKVLRVDGVPTIAAWFKFVEVAVFTGLLCAGVATCFCWLSFRREKRINTTT